MLTKKSLSLLFFPLTFSAVYAKPLRIPQAEIDLKFIEQKEARYVYKSTKKLKNISVLEKAPANWFNLSPADGAEGVRTEEAYKAMASLSQGQEVIVAVLDSGVDVNHEDLQGKIWINRGEIPNNNLDDDNNGYVDDVYGWNFIGGPDGMAQMVEDASLANGLRLIKGKPEAQVEADTLELVRELVRMTQLKNKVEELGEELSTAQLVYLNKLKAEVDENVTEAKSVLELYHQRQKSFLEAKEILSQAGLTDFSLEGVRSFKAGSPDLEAARTQLLALLSKGITEQRISRILNAYGERLAYHYNVDFNPRNIVKDNYLNPNERYYGNNDVIGADPSHGTHVSGIIAAVRNNNLGMDGVALKVKIMAIRAIPNGDERDKDVANGIRYAVDNGAKIINMSFGKGYSPYKKVVDEAVKYAESKGVLLVHAAGNDNKNNDSLPSFPNRSSKADNIEFNNWLEIGASSYKKGLTLPADFSNFGKKTVDFFAPGVDIYSTTPDNTYDTYSGTSMATPVAAGVAAVILSQSPGLDAYGVKNLMIDTSRRYPQQMVNQPGTENPVLFSSLSTYGSVVDLFEALKTLY